MAEQVEMIFFDVQQGNSTYIKSPNGKHIVIDLGAGSFFSFNNKDFSPLLHLQKQYNVQQLDYVIITHPHKGHIADIMNFVELVPKALITHPCKFTRGEIIKDMVSKTDLPFYERYMAINEYYEQKAEHDYQRDLENSENFGGLKMKLFCLKKNNSTLYLNNHSIITVLEYATIKVIITGDNEAPSFKWLLENQFFAETIKNAAILLAPYHGREEGFCKDFVEVVNPRLIVISDSKYYKEANKQYDYEDNSRGWTVHYKEGIIEEDSKTFSTYLDRGALAVTFGWNEANKPFLHTRSI